MWKGEWVVVDGWVFSFLSCSIQLLLCNIFFLKHKKGMKKSIKILYRKGYLKQGTTVESIMCYASTLKSIPLAALNNKRQRLFFYLFYFKNKFKFFRNYKKDKKLEGWRLGGEGCCRMLYRGVCYHDH